MSGRLAKILKPCLKTAVLPSDKKRIHLSGKPSEAGADAERIGIYLQRVCHRGVSFSSAPLVDDALRS